VVCAVCRVEVYLFLSKFFGRGYVYNMVGCSVIPVVMCPYFGGEMQQSTKWMWMVEDVTGIVL
jgi:hypothetical protein